MMGIKQKGTLTTIVDFLQNVQFGSVFSKHSQEHSLSFFPQDFVNLKVTQLLIS